MRFVFSATLDMPSLKSALACWIIWPPWYRTVFSRSRVRAATTVVTLSRTFGVDLWLSDKKARDFGGK